MTTATVRGEASVNGSGFCPAEIRDEAVFDYVRSETATRPDPAWEHADAAGHFHAFAAGGETPTLTAYDVHVACDGSCGGTCGGEGYDETHWKCAICGEEVTPRFVPDEEARTAGVPVLASRSSTVTVRGTGPLPPVGQRDNGDGTFTLDAAPAKVTVRARTGEGELVGTGYASVSLTFRAGRAEWTVTVAGPPLLPRLITSGEGTS